MSWSRPALLTATAIAATWARVFVDNEQLWLGLTVLALGAAITAAAFVLTIVSGRGSS